MGMGMWGTSVFSLRYGQIWLISHTIDVLPKDTESYEVLQLTGTNENQRKTELEVFAQ